MRILLQALGCSLLQDGCGHNERMTYFQFLQSKQISELKGSLRKMVLQPLYTLLVAVSSWPDKAHITPFVHLIIRVFSLCLINLLIISKFEVAWMNMSNAQGQRSRKKNRTRVRLACRKADYPFYRATNLTLSFLVAKRKSEPWSVTNS